MEVLLCLNDNNIFGLPPPTSSALNRVICPIPTGSRTYVSTLSLLGLSLILFGSILRLVCFRKLGNLFTFDLTMFPAHTLVTSGPYAYVRHPSYTGTLALCTGLALVNLSAGSWMVECGILGRGAISTVVRVLGPSAWMTWWFAVGVTRCRSEDEELKKKFGVQWDTYAAHVKAWFVPGLL